MENDLNILVTVESLIGPLLDRRNHAELALPVTQHVGLHPHQARHLADLEIELIGNLNAHHALSSESSSTIAATSDFSAPLIIAFNT